MMASKRPVIQPVLVGLGVGRGGVGTDTGVSAAVRLSAGVGVTVASGSGGMGVGNGVVEGPMRSSSRRTTFVSSSNLARAWSRRGSGVGVELALPPQTVSSNAATAAPVKAATLPGAATSSCLMKFPLSARYKLVTPMSGSLGSPLGAYRLEWLRR